MTKTTFSDLALSPIGPRKIVAKFDGGLLSSDGGLLVLRQIDKRVGLSEGLAACLTDPRDPARIHHSQTEMMASRIMAIAAGYEDCDDLDALREDPALKMGIGRAPQSGLGLPSQPTLSRFENRCAQDTASWRGLARMGLKLIDVFCASYKTPPQSIILDIDDTPDIAHGGQQLCLFNGFVGDYCFRPIHVYEGQSGKPITCLLFPGKRPDGAMVARIIRHLVQRIVRHLPNTAITLRGDSHYASHKAMDWLEARGHSYIFGLATNKALQALAQPWSDEVATTRALCGEYKTRDFFGASYAAGSWSKQRQIVARIEATKREDLSERAMDLRFIVTNCGGLSDKALYQDLYCARGQAENFIKDHKLYTASDRTSCHKWQANQFRLFLHTAAYWLLHQVRDSLDPSLRLARATFETIRRSLVKIAVRISELGTRIKLSFAQSCAHQRELKQLCKTWAEP